MQAEAFAISSFLFFFYFIFGLGEEQFLVFLLGSQSIYGTASAQTSDQNFFIRRSIAALINNSYNI